MLGLNRKFFLSLLSCLLFLLTSFAWNNASIIPAAGALVVDQQQTTHNWGAELLATPFYWQSFTPSVDGIAGVSVCIQNYNTEDPSVRYLIIMLDDASDGITPLAMDTIDLYGLDLGIIAWYDVTFTTVSITVSSTYYIILYDDSYTTTDDRFEWRYATSDVYSGGMLYNYPSLDAAFKTYYDDLVTPEFDTFMLLLGFTHLGLLLMVIYLVRKR